MYKAVIYRRLMTCVYIVALKFQVSCSSFKIVKEIFIKSFEKKIPKIII